MRVLVTGGAGFIGSNLVEHLLKNKEAEKVIVIDNLSSGCKENIQDFVGDQRFEFHKSTFIDLDIVKKITKGVDLILHEGAMTGVPQSIADPVQCMQINVIGTVNILEGMRINDVENFIFASSGSVYGEARYLPMDEEHPTNPKSPYGASKLVAEQIINLYHRLYGLKTVIIRYSSVYGPRQRLILDKKGNVRRGSILPLMLSRIMENKPPIIFGDGKQTRNFVFIKDVVVGTMLAAKSKDAIGQTFNLAGKETISINEFVNILLRVTGKRLKPIYKNSREGDIKMYSVENARMKKILNFEPQYTFEQGLKESVEWWKTNKGVVVK